MDDASRAAAAERAERVRELHGDFGRRMAVIYTTLCSEHLQHNQRAPYLRQLLLRLNFNGYMEASALEGALKGSAAESSQ